MSGDSLDPSINDLNIQEFAATFTTGLLVADSSSALKHDSNIKVVACNIP
jgi:hypothetical protein